MVKNYNYHKQNSRQEDIHMKELNAKLIERNAIFTQILSDTNFQVDLDHLFKKIHKVLRHGGKILLCGNGGSAADCQHIAGEFVGRLKKNRPAWPALSLAADVSVLTCLANDYSYENIFKRQIEAFGNQGDLLIALSTSGNSENIYLAIQAAKEKHMDTYSITNQTGGKISGISDNTFKIPSTCTQVVQELTITLFHIICEALELDEDYE